MRTLKDFTLALNPTPSEVCLQCAFVFLSLLQVLLSIKGPITIRTHAAELADANTEAFVQFALILARKEELLD